jgi:hypothetical protein
MVSVLEDGVGSVRATDAEWLLAKAWLPNPDEVEPVLENLEISPSLNEQQHQLASSSQLIWKLGNERIPG